MSQINSAFEAEEVKSDVSMNWVSEVQGSKESPTSRGFGGNVTTKSEAEVSQKVDMEMEIRNIVVVGSGDFGRALAGRLAKAGYHVTIASRDVNKVDRSLVPPGVEISGLDLITKADLVIICIPKDFYPSLPEPLFSGKIVVDVSNRSTQPSPSSVSQAEYLQELLPNTKVVKAFNVLSAYSLENGGLQGSKQVPIAGNSSEAKSVVGEVIKKAGFMPQDMGGLESARDIEDIPLAFFPLWKKPFLIHLGIFCFLYFLSFAKFQICWPLTWSESFMWELWNHIPMDNVNKTLAGHALNTLALVYLPGVLAGWLQIFRGTKYSRFPAFLDSWLKMRKQLGVLMFAAAAVHACLSLAIMSPTYHDLVYGHPKEIWVNTVEKEGWGPGTPSENKTSVKVVGGEKMGLRGEMFLITGVFGFLLVSLLALTSLPSVTNSLSWKEFTFIQSKLGWLSLLLFCAHDMFYGWPYMNSPSCYIPSGFQYALYIPLVTILLKVPLLLPPLSTNLWKIRAGYVRSPFKGTHV